jgi:hypothetical protein
MNAPVTKQDRQRHVRTATLLRGELAAGDVVCACEMLNLSVGGARLRLEVPTKGLDRVCVRIDGYPGLTGNVVWRADREIGVEFDYECRETAQRLQAETKPDHVPQDRRRTIRVSVLWSGRVLAAEGTNGFACMVLNISAEGARLRLSTPATESDFDVVRLHIDRLGTLPGRVAWREADEMAITFDEDPDRIAEMLSAVLPRAQFAALDPSPTDAAAD